MAFIGSTTPLKKVGDAPANKFTSQVVRSERADYISGVFATDVAGNLVVEQSGDGQNFDFKTTVAAVPGSGKDFNVPLYCGFVQITFTNTAATDQTYFRLSARFTSAGDS